MEIVLGDVIWILSSVTFSTVLARSGLKKKSLSKSGAAAAFVVGTITFLCGLRFGITLIAFYWSSSKLTKYKSEVKMSVEENFKEGGQRDWSQVLANSFTATCATLCLLCCTRSGSRSSNLMWWEAGSRDPCLDSVGEGAFVTALLGAFLGHYACCNGDTWASEVGILSSEQPRLITTWKHVPRGTNGGMSLIGTAASAAGGLFISTVFAITGLFTTGPCHPGGAGGGWAKQVAVIPVGLFAGVFGSAVDSLLGATCQYSGFCSVRKKVVDFKGQSVQHITGLPLLSNTNVNFISSLITSVMTASIVLCVF